MLFLVKLFIAISVVKKYSPHEINTSGYMFSYSMSVYITEQISIIVSLHD